MEKVTPDSYALPADTEGTSMKAEFFYNDVPGSKESDTERIARGDLMWSNTKQHNPPKNRFMVGDITLDRFLLKLTITQKNMNWIAAAYIFSLIGEWSSYIMYIIFVFVSETFSGFPEEHEELNLTTIMWKINAGILLSSQLLCYLSRMLTIVVFIVFSLITLYICIIDRKAYRFYQQKK